MLVSILAILVFVLLATVATLVVNRRIFTVSDNDFSVELAVTDFKREIKRLARAVKITENGGRGYDPSGMKNTFQTAKNLLKNKIDKNRELTHAERWIYENYYLLMRTLSASRYTGQKLPHYNGTPRIIIFARKIVRLSGAGFNRERLMLALSTFVSETPLTLGEIFYLETAIKIAILEDIYVIAKKLLHAEKMYRLATFKPFKASLLDSDIYKKFVLDNKISCNYARDYLFKSGVNLENVDFNYTSLVVERDRRAERAFSTLHNLTEIVNTEEIVCAATVSTVLSLDDVYRDTDYQGKICVLREIERLSDKLRVSEYMTAKLLTDCSVKGGNNIFEILFDMKRAFKKFLKNKNKVFRIKKDCAKAKERVYIGAVILSAVCAAAGFYFLPLPIGLKAAVMALSFLPLFLIFSGLYEKIIAWFAESRPIPALKCADNRTLIVVSEYIGSENQIENAIDHLEALKQTNEHENAVFSLLIDFAGADKEKTENDEKLLEIIEKRLKDKKGYNVFIRNRTKISENKYQGYERKRGAIEQLNSYLLKESDNMRYVLDKDMEMPEFVLLLDADNTTAPYAVNEMVKTMAHPFNGKYDLMVSPARCGAISAKSRFSKRFISKNTVSQYPDYSNLYFNAFSKAVFCGKGIYRLSRFKAALEGKISENTVLSHDILEGAILSTGMLSTPVYEEAPKNFISEFERRNRWRRGDLMLIPYLKEKMSPIYRFVMVKNVFSVYMPLFLLSLFLCFAFSGSMTVLYTALALTFITPVTDALSALKCLFFKRRLRYVLIEAVRGFFYAVEEFFTLPFYAVNSLILSANLLVKRLKRGNMLEWRTYYQSQTASAKGKQFKLCAPSAAVSLLLAAAVFLFGTSLLAEAACAAYLLASLIFVLLCAVGKEKKEKQALNHSEREILKGLAANIYRYFEYNRGELVGDNLQVKNYKGLAKRTSPTNIGYSLLAEISAHYIGLSDTAETVKNLKAVLERVAPLKKWKGNLYNWYDTVTLEPMFPRFVSSVDSGNFVASLIVAAEFLKLAKEHDAAALAEDLIAQTDLGALFDAGRNLFYIGFNENEGKFKSHYDLLASEARLLSYVATGLGFTNYKHWNALSRECSPLFGNTLYSWSGTAFEYLMAEQFIAAPVDTLIGRSVLNAVKTSKKRKCNGVWGVSESAYYSFDNEGNYQYKAFGLSELALRSEKNECVISPYSSIMALNYAPRCVFRNLMRLSALKMQGEFGYYDALDMRSEPKVVATFMAHHQGMALVGFANYLNGSVIPKLFYKNLRMKGSETLLNETVCEKTVLAKIGEKFSYIPNFDKEYFELNEKVEQYPKINLLRSQNHKVLIDERGNGFSLSYGKLINRFQPDYLTDQGMFFYVYEKGLLHSAAPSPITGTDSFTSFYTDNEAGFLNNNLCSKMCVVAPACIPGEVRRIEIKNDEGERRNFKLYFYCDITLLPHKEYISHPVFNNLFVETKIDAEKKAVIVKRRSKEAEGDFFAAFLYDENSIFDIETNRYNFIGRNRGLSNPVYFEDRLKSAPSIGDVLEPCVAIGTDVELQPGEKFDMNIVVLTANNEQQLYSNIEKVRSQNIYEYALNSSENVRTDGLSRKLACELLFKPYSARQLKRIDLLYNEEFSRLTDRGENKLIVYDFKSIEEISVIIRLNKIANELSEFNLPFKIAVLYDEEDGYHERIKREIVENINNPRIILLERTEKNEKIKELAFIVLDKELHLPLTRIMLADSDYKKGEAAPEHCKTIKMKTGEGGFTDDGYAVVPFGSETMLPYSNVIGEKFGGFVVTDNGGGFTFFYNSRENKASTFKNDPVSDEKSERIWLLYLGKYYDLTSGASCIHKKGETIFKGSAAGKSYELKEFMLCEGKIKIFQFNFLCGSSEKIRLLFEIEPALCSYRSADLTYIYEESGVLTAKNVVSGQSVTLKGLGEKTEYISDKSKLYARNLRGLNFDTGASSYFNNPALAAIIEPERFSGEFRGFVVLGADRQAVKDISAENIAKEYAKTRESYERIGNVRLNSGNKPLDVLFNDCLLYQVKASRLNAKAGYYQVGGAFGFRDQLQDVLAFIDSDPALVRRMLIKMAEHQYTEGDVMHWWHEPYQMGLRSRVSDDKLFLPYVLGEYVSRSGDVSILTEKVFYLYSPALEGAKGRYECANTAFAESMTEHAKRAIESALLRGEHGLLLIGSGDWNDALDEVGTLGKGESVPLTMLCIAAMQSILPYVENDIREQYSLEISRLNAAIKKHGFISYFRRGYKDDGVSFGDPASDSIKIDLLSQSFASMFDICEVKMQESALNFAASLEDCENKIIKLLSPPLDKGKYLGYISAYPKGVRENGGQYTHSAVWYLYALLKHNRVNRAYELLNWLNPIERGMNEALFKKYKAEPYVLCGDVYSNLDNPGRAGWSWYTGSAGWLYRLIKEEFLGLKKFGGELAIRPKLPDKLNNAEVEYYHENAVIKIKYILSDRYKLVYEKIELKNTDRIPLVEGKNAEITVYVEKQAD